MRTQIAGDNCAAAARRASSERRTVALLTLVTLLAAATPAGAQSPPDSVEARLRRAEQAIALLQQQLADATSAGTQSRSRVRLELYGRVLVNAFGNSRRVNNVDNPQFVLADPAPAPGTPKRGIGMAIRETTLGLAVSGAEVLGGSFRGDLDVDFYGGQQPSSGGRNFPLLRLRTARGFVRWRHAELLVGQESPLISRLNPATVAAFGTPAFATSGNLWLWLPQVRVRGETGERLRLGVEAGVLAPASGDPATAFDTDYDLAERSQRPSVEARAFVGWGEADTRSEVGCGVHTGSLMSASSRQASRAIACDAQGVVTDWMEVRGEAFSGRALRGLGGGGIGQNFDALGRTFGTSGAWAQVNLRPFPALRFGAGCGGDHPEPAGPRLRNDSCASYLTFRPPGPVFVGTELRRIRTEYYNGRYTNDHVTVAFGWEF